MKPRWLFRLHFRESRDLELLGLASAAGSQVAGQKPLQSLSQILEDVKPICTLDRLGSGSFRC
jgi:hypothetical protein